MAINVDGRQEIDIKKYAKVEKIPGGDVMESRVLKGVMFQKDVVAPGRMRRCGVLQQLTNTLCCIGHASSRWTVPRGIHRDCCWLPAFREQSNSWE